MTTCHVCGSSRSEEVLTTERHSLGVNRCLSCGFVYLASWEKSLEHADALYDYYGQITDEDMRARHSAENQQSQERLLEELARHARGRTLLDVGCGDGQFLETARRRGWDALGIDLSEPAVLLCQRRGLAASKTDFFDRSLDAKRFDVIIMSELIEHVRSPQRFLRRASDLLETGGILYLTTPNFGSLARRMLGGSWSVFHPEHIGYFERSTLRKMASEHTALREIKIEARNLSPSTFAAWIRGHRDERSCAPSTAKSAAGGGLDQQLRSAIHKSRALSASKDVMNNLVSRSGLGDTLVAWLQKPASAT